MDNKTDLRLWVKSVRKNLDISSKSAIIASKIRDLGCYKKAENVMLFYPKTFEIDLRPLLSDDKNFYLPRVCGENLLVCPFEIGDEVKLSEFKICEPCSNPVEPDKLDLVIVPALAVDKNGYRLGYGGGFYDRFLSKYPVKSLSVVCSEFVLETVHPEKFDIKVDFLVTD